MENLGPLVRLQSVSKAYPIANSSIGRLRTLKALLTKKPFSDRFDALSDVSLDVRKGESLGLIGVNGAGKSTLLKIIAGVVKPTSGVLEVNGRISALLELGAGFHPEYTGRQNVFLAAALMGLSEREAQDKLESILGFADIGAHIDQPIKHYSSGMVVRLGFAVATAVRPDILITDEVLAVGDESFQRKCISWMESYLNDGGTLLLCAHSMFHIQKLCRKAVWIDAGKVRLYGDASDVTRDYLAWHDARSSPPRNIDAVQAVRAGNYAIVDLRINGAPKDAPVDARFGETLVIEGEVFSPEGRAPSVAIGFVRVGGAPVYGISSDMDNCRLMPVDGSCFRFRLVLPALQLLPGLYQIRAHAMDPEGYRLFDEVHGSLTVTGETREMGLCRLEHRWET